MSQTLGRYVLEKKIGSGGMADVYLARGPMGVCVVKAPHPHLCGNPEFVRMFLDEAALLAQLHHPGIAQIYDLGQDRGAYYLAMEYVPGFDLMTISLEHERHGELMEPALCARIVADVAAALHYAHEATGANGQPLNIIHRDVSPHNVLLSTQGVVKLIDFGVAKAASAMHRTQAGFVKGKYPYMAPEQVTGQAIDRRVDVYALGLVLYELLTNVRAIAGNTELEQIDNARIGRVRPIEQLRPNVPVPLRQIIGGCLFIQPEGRYPTALAVQQDLEKYLALERQALGTEDLLRLFRVVAAEVGVPGEAVDLAAGRPTELEQPISSGGAVVVPDAAGAAAVDELGYSTTVPSMKSTAHPAHVPAAPTALETPAGPAPQPLPLTTSVPAGPSPGRPATGKAPPHPAAPPPRDWRPAAVLGGLAVVVGVLAWAVFGARQGPAVAAPRDAPAAVEDAGIPGAIARFEFPAPDAEVAPVDAGPAAVVEQVPVAEPEPPPAPREDSAMRVATINVTATVPAELLVDGQPWGKTPAEVQLMPGKHTVTVSNAQLGLRRSFTLTLKAGESRDLAVSAARGKVEVECTPFAQISVDGKRITTVPVAMASTEVFEGQHAVECVLEDASLPAPKRKKTTVLVKGGETARVTLPMLQD